MLTSSKSCEGKPKWLCARPDLLLKAWKLGVGCSDGSRLPGSNRAYGLLRNHSEHHAVVPFARLESKVGASLLPWRHSQGMDSTADKSP